MSTQPIEKRGLRYVNYFGDGGSKSFNAVEFVYPGINVLTFECICHYQKCVSNRLRKLKTKTKGLDGKNKTTKLHATDGVMKKIKRGGEESIE